MRTAAYAIILGACLGAAIASWRTPAYELPNYGLRLLLIDAVVGAAVAAALCPLGRSLADPCRRGAALTGVGIAALLAAVTLGLSYTVCRTQQASPLCQRQLPSMSPRGNETRSGSAGDSRAHQQHEQLCPQLDLDRQTGRCCPPAVPREPPP
jgi:hypothetical protein